MRHAHSGWALLQGRQRLWPDCQVVAGAHAMLRAGWGQTVVEWLSMSARTNVPVMGSAAWASVCATKASMDTTVPGMRQMPVCHSLQRCWPALHAPPASAQQLPVGVAVRQAKRLCTQFGIMSAMKRRCRPWVPRDTELEHVRRRHRSLSTELWGLCRSDAGPGAAALDCTSHD